MWEGIRLKGFQNNIYRNFYSDSDIELINGAEDADSESIKRLIHKARKIGDFSTAYSLEDMYVELLRIPDKHYAPLPPRSEIEAEYQRILREGLVELEKRNKSRMMRPFSSV